MVNIAWMWRTNQSNYLVTYHADSLRRSYAVLSMKMSAAESHERKTMSYTCDKWKYIREALNRLAEVKRKCLGLAGAYTIFRNRIRHLKPLTAVPLSTFAFTAAVVMSVYHSLTCTTPQQPHVVAVRSTSDTQVFPQSATKNVIQVNPYT